MLARNARRNTLTVPTPNNPDPHDAAASTVWVLHGSNARFASGVFRSRADGLAWAERHRLSGTLSAYPVGVGCYDQAVAAGSFRRQCGASAGR
ncbi:DUF7710 domain-containing protein [Micromonospora taraxaci]|uniref:DUF7710 domain-containing protein n=1 Tax=Micromonospora taraxaci TaxID=1316803 RepID=UPI003F4D3A72